MNGKAWMCGVALAAGLGAAVPAYAQSAAPVDPALAGRIEAAAAAIQPRVVAWRRDIHQNPELGNAEHRTAALVAEHLRGLGLEVRTGVAHTGVVAVLRGGRPGRTVALRADMDALPVQEATGLPFASTATGTYQGATVPVAHACGHDAHVAMLMGAAEILAGMREELSGTIVFVFQPAEEGAPPGEEGGADLMVAEGALNDPRPEAIFGLHVVPGRPGTAFWRGRGFMAASDRVDIELTGRQTHGAWPWKGIDIVAVAGQVVQTINTLAARTVDPTTTPTVFTIATVNGGVRYNIIPDRMTLSGTLRTFDTEQHDDLVRRAGEAVNHVAAAYGASADFRVVQNAPVVFNDETLAAWLGPVLGQALGSENVNPAAPPTMVAEDFSYYQREIPGVFYHLGASADGVDPATSPPNHSPQFDVNERVLETGVRAHVMTALAFLSRS
ncbi:amidohydrolase [Brevundimonas sp. 2R-24]|uniref:Amidohydrolase n=1 Tax=Peiella sedimenti TaxID=3061083 RepID=A0ABT8SJH4_9CAUL|nr:amidohydrolase [Caulobacteraceae bacterium XZ-24]